MHQAHTNASALIHHVCAAAVLAAGSVDQAVRLAHIDLEAPLASHILESVLQYLRATPRPLVTRELTCALLALQGAVDMFEDAKLAPVWDDSFDRRRANVERYARMAIGLTVPADAR